MRRDAVYHRYLESTISFLPELYKIKVSLLAQHGGCTQVTPSVARHEIGVKPIKILHYPWNSLVLIKGFQCGRQSGIEYFKFLREAM